MRANHGTALKAMEERHDALSVVSTAADMAIREIRNHVGLAPHEFDKCFERADRTETTPR